MNKVLILFGLLSGGQLFGQIQLDWQELPPEIPGDTALVHMRFEGSTLDDHALPIYASESVLPVKGNSRAVLMDASYRDLDDRELKLFLEAHPNTPAESASIESSWTTAEGVDYVVYHIFPFRKNPQTGKIQKLMSFDVAIERIWGAESTETSVNKTGSWTTNSVLSTGQWVRAGIPRSGIYAVTVAELEGAGLALSGVPTDELRMYHNGGGMLPEPIDEPRHGDLREAAIWINDGGDGMLHPGDRIFFYAGGPHAVRYNSKDDRLEHAYNVYSELSYVFFTLGGSGLRVTDQAWNGGVAAVQSAGFDELRYHELDERNIAGTGREWYGEVFDFNLSKTIAFDFPNRQAGEPATVRFRGAGKALKQGTKFEVYHGGSMIISAPIQSKNSYQEFTVTSGLGSTTGSGNTLGFEVRYNRSASPSAIGYLDFLSVQARRAWQYASGGFIARDTRVIHPDSVVMYALSGHTPDMQIWDVTDPGRAFRPELSGSGTVEWLAPGDSLRTYAVWRESDALAVTSITSQKNQNLHAFDAVDMLIVSHASFLNEANRLAQFHRENTGLRVEVVDVRDVYAEFSAGAQDITAIRDLAQMLYKRNPDPDDKLNYLLLFGDASYDYKNRTPNNHNFVPVFESKESTGLYFSFMTDDYYACLDSNEGRNVILEKLDINVGRLPVKTVAEAGAAVDKIIGYAVSANSYGDWRNRITFVADDADLIWEPILTRVPEQIARRVDTVYPNFNIEKIYLDSYTQVSTSGSQSYPDAHDALFRSVQRGNLVTTYVGHGGEVGWASERVLTLQDVQTWSNGVRLPLFVTITCEFTRFDDPFRTSAGEQLFLNPNGGAIGLITTTRVVFVDPATALNREVFKMMFEKVNGQYPTLGDIVRRSKNAIPSGTRSRFSLIGDPALRLNIPVNEMVVDSINGRDIALMTDTARAQNLVSIAGRVLNSGGSTDSVFDGEASITVYDKPLERETRGNDGWDKVSFIQQENVIYRGRVSVNAGHWNTEFVVPRDINYRVDFGKISLYADNDISDAAGSDKRLYVGDLGTPEFTDNQGPEIRLYMNDTNFRSGGITDENPLGLAFVFDSSGVNVVGNGIGHDIVGILDNDHNNPILLNSYYESDLDTYQSGRVSYPFFNLSNGSHNLKIRVWDVFNNVSEARVNFVVADRGEIVIDEVFGFPNPFSDVTTINFEHNRDGEDLLVTLVIYDMNGHVVHSQEARFRPEGNRDRSMTWDGRNGSGAEVSNGVYVFRLNVRSMRDGQEGSTSERLVFLK